MRRSVLRLPANACFGEFTAGRKLIIPIEDDSWSRDLEDVVSFLLGREEDLWMVELIIQAVGFKDRVGMLRTMLGRLRGKGPRDVVRFQAQACEVGYQGKRATPTTE